MTNNLKVGTVAVTFRLPHEAAEVLSEFLLASGSSGLLSEDKEEFTALITEETPDYQAEDYLAELDNDCRLTAYFRARWTPELEISALKTPQYNYSLYGIESDEWQTVTEFREETLAPQIELIAENLGVQISLSGIQEVVEEDWAEKWKEHFLPLSIGEHLYIRPLWRDDPIPEGRLLMEMEPGAAFGSGTHPTSELCLEYIDREFGGAPDLSELERLEILDLGCGTGILGIATALLTGAEVEMIDFDPYAVERAEVNAAANHLELDIHQGELKSAHKSHYDYIIANLITRLHLSLISSYKARLKAGGKLVLSGILEEALTEIWTAFSSYGFSIIECQTRGDWSMLVLKLKD